MLVDIEDCCQLLKVGDVVCFELDYMGLLMVCQIKGVVWRFMC